MFHKLAAKIQSHREAMVDLTMRLVAIPTENPPGNHYRKCADLLCAELKQLGFDETASKEIAF
jgi:succinyl-diaminopimelate desuccinylase